MSGETSIDPDYLTVNDVTLHDLYSLFVLITDYTHLPVKKSWQEWIMFLCVNIWEKHGLFFSATTQSQYDPWTEHPMFQHKG